MGTLVCWHLLPPGDVVKLTRGSEKVVAMGMAMAGGYSDAASYLLAHTFTGHVTGNMVLAAISLAQVRFSSLGLISSAIAFFLLGTYLGQRLKASIHRTLEIRPLRITVAVELLLVIMAPIPLIFHLPHAVIGMVVCLASAMGLQNGSYSKTGAVSLHTTYLTGTITTLVSAVAKQAAGDEPALKKRQTAAIILRVCLCFLLGAAAAGMLVPRYGAFVLWGLALPLSVAAFAYPSPRQDEKTSSHI